MKRVKRKRARVPVKKYSEVFLEYAAPLLEHADCYTGFCGAVRWAEVAWNAAVLDRRDGSDHVARAKVDLGQSPDAEHVLVLIDYLVERRLSEFGEHEWLIGEVTVRDDGDEYVVRVEAREGGE